jgi:hypothetical protein
LKPPRRIDRWDEARDRIVIAADHPAHLGERTVVMQRRLPGVVTVFAADERQHLATLLVDPVHAWSAVEPDILQISQQRVHGGSPRAGLPPYRCADTGRGRRTAAAKRLFWLCHAAARPV